MPTAGSGETNWEEIGMRLLLGGDENALKWIIVIVVQFCEYAENKLNCPLFKWVNYISMELLF